jgi:hypothetical protein
MIESYLSVVSAPVGADDSFSYLRGVKALLLFELVSRERFLDADGAARGMVILKTTVQTLMAVTFIAIAVAG